MLVTVVHGKPRQGIDFFPLTVDFVEKTSAAGKIPGGFFKREARLSDREVLVCRFIDRAVRPLFAEGYNDDTMVMATVLSADGENAPDIAAFIGASAALTISEIPFLGPIAAVRVGRIGEEFITNPTTEQMAESDMDFVVGGSRQALVMVEGGADAANEDDVLAALQFAHGEVIRLVDLQEDLQRRIGKPKIELSTARDRSTLEQEIRGKVGSRLEAATQIKDKKERTDAIKTVEGEIRDGYIDAFRSEKVAFDSLEAVDARRDAERQLGADVKETLHDLRAEAVRNRVLETGERIDGRGLRIFARSPVNCGSFRARTAWRYSRAVRPGAGDHDPRWPFRCTDDRFAHRALHEALLSPLQLPGYSTGEPRPNRGPVAERWGTAISRSAPSSPCCRVQRIFPTRSGSCRRPSSRMVLRRWPRFVAARFR